MYPIQIYAVGDIQLIALFSLCMTVMQVIFISIYLNNYYDMQYVLNIAEKLLAGR